MWKYVKLHFSVNTKILEFLKVHHFFMGFGTQICFQILTLEFAKIRFSQKESKKKIWKKNVIFDQKLLVLNFLHQNVLPNS